MNERQTQSTNTTQSFELRANLYWIVPLLVIAIACVWWYLTAWIWVNQSGLAQSSQVGDSFGAVNALFSGLALAGVVIAILLQSEDLRAQERAMELQTQEMKDTTEALEAQTKLLASQVGHAVVQEFDAKFFELLRLARTTWDNTETRKTPGINADRSTQEMINYLTKAESSSHVRPEPNGHDFRTKHGRDYEPATQMMSLALDLVAQNPTPRIYATIWKAAFNQYEKFIFGYVQFFDKKEIPAAISRVIEDYALFEGLEPKLKNANRFGLKPLGFGEAED